MSSCSELPAKITKFGVPSTEFGSSATGSWRVEVGVGWRRRKKGRLFDLCAIAAIASTEHSVGGTKKDSNGLKFFNHDSIIGLNGHSVVRRTSSLRARWVNVGGGGRMAARRRYVRGSSGTAKTHYQNIIRRRRHRGTVDGAIWQMNFYTPRKHNS